MRVFVTGIAGFIGSTLASILSAKGCYIFGVDNLFTGKKENVPSNIDWKVSDIGNADFYKGFDLNFDIVIHLAAQTSGEKSFELPIYDMDTNLKGSFNVYQFAKRCKAKLMINMSSMSVYGDVPNRMIIDESYCPRPVSLYGNTKLAAENLLAMLSRVDNLPVVSLRLFNAYGPKQNLDEMKQGMVSIFLAYFLRHERVIVKGPVDRVRDFIYIDDIISAVVKIIESECYRSGVYNLSTARIVSVNEILMMIKEVTNIDKEIVVKGETRGDITGFGGGYDKFKKMYGWEPKISIEKGLSKMISSYLS